MFLFFEQEPPTTEEAVLAWMESLREGHSPGNHSRRGHWAGFRPDTPPMAGIKPGQPVSSVRDAALRIEGQMAGGSTPAPDQLLRTRNRGHHHGTDFEAAPARFAAPPAAHDPAQNTALQLDSDGALPSAANPPTGVNEPPDEPGALSASEDDVVPELPEYGDEYSDEDGRDGRYEAYEGPVGAPVGAGQPGSAVRLPVRAGHAGPEREEGLVLWPHVRQQAAQGRRRRHRGRQIRRAARLAQHKRG